MQSATTSIRSLYKVMPSNQAKIQVSGWIRTIRDSKTFGFIELNDGTFFRNLQIVMEEGRLANFKDIAHLPEGSAIRVRGELILTPDMKQPFELKADEILVEGLSTSDYPLQKKRHSMEYLRTIAHLRPRTNVFSAVFRVRSLAAFAIHKFFSERDFVYVHTPLITSCDAEGAGEMFQVTTMDLKNIPKTQEGTVDYTKDFFGKETSLTVTGQLNAECFALAFRNVYTFGPTFRAERSNTTRHVAEFWMIEPEIAFADLEDDMNLAEDMTRYIIDYVLSQAPEEMEFLDNFVAKGLVERLSKVASTDFARITYTQAIEILQKAEQTFDFEPVWGIALQTEHERFLSETTFGRPVFVTDYPKEVKAFYMRMNDDQKTVAATDMLVPGIGELIGASQREERMEQLEKRITELGMDIGNYDWYLELRKYGGVKHAGFGIGFERLIMYLTGMTNIRDVLPFPRTPKNAEF